MTVVNITPHTLTRTCTLLAFKIFGIKDFGFYM